MASLIIQDAFEPYYAGRDSEAKARAKLQAAAKKPAAKEAEIVLPADAAPHPENRPRDGRRATQH